MISLILGNFGFFFYRRLEELKRENKDLRDNAELNRVMTAKKNIKLDKRYLIPPKNSRYVKLKNSMNMKK